MRNKKLTGMLGRLLYVMNVYKTLFYFIQNFILSRLNEKHNFSFFLRVVAYIFPNDKALKCPSYMANI